MSEEGQGSDWDLGNFKPEDLQVESVGIFVAAVVEGLDPLQPLDLQAFLDRFDAAVEEALSDLSGDDETTARTRTGIRSLQVSLEAGLRIRAHYQDLGQRLREQGFPGAGSDSDEEDDPPATP